MIKHVKSSLAMARKLESNLTPVSNQGKSTGDYSDNRVGNLILTMPGMSGIMTRHFLNNLCSYPGIVYTEVGVWTGSTFCSAVYKNPMKLAWGIDNFSQFSGKWAVEKFLENNKVLSDCDVEHTIRELKGKKLKLTVQDFRAVDFSNFISEFGEIDIYFFDGPHDVTDQRDGIILAYEALAENFVLIVDDWNWDCVREGTESALKTLGTVIQYQVEIFTPTDSYWIVEGPSTIVYPNGAATMSHHQSSNWHNGLSIFACTKA